jgi:hypothetical protein
MKRPAIFYKKMKTFICTLLTGYQSIGYDIISQLGETWQTQSPPPRRRRFCLSLDGSQAKPRLSESRQLWKNRLKILPGALTASQALRIKFWHTLSHYWQSSKKFSPMPFAPAGGLKPLNKLKP